MTTPIRTMVQLHGADAILTSAATPPGYDPTADADYDPGTDTPLNIRAYPEAKMEHVEGAIAAVSFAADEKPEGLRANDSELFWAGDKWKVIKYRPRFWKGKLDGFTLYLAI